MSLNYNEKNIILAKNLRKNATPQENHLWYDFLAKYELRFQRQKAIDNFIADFYCHKAKLVIEIDGSQHYTEEGREKDEFRTEILEGSTLKVIRFTNHQITPIIRTSMMKYWNLVVLGVSIKILSCAAFFALEYHVKYVISSTTEMANRHRYASPVIIRLELERKSMGTK